MGHTNPQPLALQASSLDTPLMFTSIIIDEYLKSITPVILECLEHTMSEDLCQMQHMATPLSTCFWYDSIIVMIIIACVGCDRGRQQQGKP